MGKDYLYKKDAEIILHKLEEGDDCYSIDITNKEYRGNYFGKWLEFQPEIDELNIVESDDDCWMCDKEFPREILKVELEKRGFYVTLG